MAAAVESALELTRNYPLSVEAWIALSHAHVNSGNENKAKLVRNYTSVLRG